MPSNGSVPKQGGTGGDGGRAKQARIDAKIAAEIAAAKAVLAKYGVK